jgi:MFS family permease
MAHAWFPTRRGLAMGIALGGFGMSPFVTAPIAEVAILHVGLRLTFLAVGLAFAVLVPLLASSFRMPRPGEVDDVTTAAAPGTATSAGTGGSLENISPREMIRRREFYALWLCLFLGSIIGLGAIAITAPWAQLVIGLSAGASAVAVSSPGGLQRGWPAAFRLHHRSPRASPDGARRLFPFRGGGADAPSWPSGECRRFCRCVCRILAPSWGVAWPSLPPRRQHSSDQATTPRTTGWSSRRTASGPLPERSSQGVSTRYSVRTVPFSGRSFS